MTKALMGAVWIIVPFTGFAVTGYYLDYIRNTAHGQETPLPDWSLFGRYWVRGLLATIAMFLYMLPAIVILSFFMGAVMLAPLASTGNDYGSSSVNGFEAMLAGGLCLGVALAVVYMIVVWIFAAAAVTHYAMHEEFSSAFAFSEIKRRLSTPNAGYMTALLMSYVISIVASSAASTVGGVLFFIPFLGWIAGAFIMGGISFLGLVMAAHLFGQYAARAYGLPGLAAVAPAYGSIQQPAPQAPPAPAPPASSPEHPVVPPAAETSEDAAGASPPSAPQAPPAAPADAPEPD
jgi:hypothetical protein